MYIQFGRDWKGFQGWELLEYVRVRVLYMKKMIKSSVFCTNERTRFCAKRQNFKKRVEFLCGLWYGIGVAREGGKNGNTVSSRRVH